MRVCFRAVVMATLLAISFSSSAQNSTDLYIGLVEVANGLRIPGDLLCQDGNNVYFKDESDCWRANKLFYGTELEELQCDQSLKVSPILDIEEIQTQKGRSFFRFYVTATEYNLVEYKVETVGNTEEHEIVSDKMVPIERCTGIPKAKRIAQKTTRTALPQEEILIRDLLSQGIQVINRPRGPLTDFYDVQFELIGKGRREWEKNNNSFTSLLDQKPFFINTFHCNTKHNAQDFIHMVSSGGWGGGGSSGKTLERWQASSTRVLVQPKKIPAPIWQDAIEGKVNYKGRLLNAVCPLEV